MAELQPNLCVYASDYRSPPSGVGTIEKANGDFILIQDKSCEPKVQEGIYKEIICIPYDMSEEYEEGQAKLESILEEHEVAIVYDAELCYETRGGGCYMTLKEFSDARKL